MKELIIYAKEASKYSYAPYSNIHIGAVLWTEKDNVYKGCNIENMSYGATICAERTAFLKAISEGDTDLKGIIIYSKDVLPIPCGMCLQFMSEFVSKDFIVHCGNDEQVKTFTLGELLPQTFKFKRGE